MKTSIPPPSDNPRRRLLDELLAERCQPIPAPQLPPPPDEVIAWEAEHRRLMLRAEIGDFALDPEDEGKPFFLVEEAG